MNNLKGNFFWLTLSEIVSKGLGFLATLYLTKTLLDSGYGLLSFVQACMSYAVIISDMGFSTYGTREVSRLRGGKNWRAELLNFFPSLLATKGAVSFFLAAIAIAALSASGIPHGMKVLFVLSFIQIIIGAFNTEWVFIGLEDMKIVGLARIFKIMLFLPCMLFYIKSELDISRVVSINIFIETLAAALMIWMLSSRHKLIPRSFTIIRDPSIIRKSAYLGLSLLMISVYYSSDMVILGLFREIREVGWYSAAYRIPLILSPGVAGIIVNVFFPHLSRYYSDIKEFKAAHAKFQTISYLASAAVLLFVPFSGFVFEFFFGDMYKPGIPAFKLLLLTNAVIFISITYGNSLIAAGHENSYMKGVLLGAASNIFLNLALIPLWGILGAAAATLLSELIVLFFMYRIFNKRVYHAPLYQPIAFFMAKRASP